MSARPAITCRVFYGIGPSLVSSVEHPEKIELPATVLTLSDAKDVFLKLLGKDHAAGTSNNVDLCSVPTEALSDGKVKRRLQTKSIVAMKTVSDLDNSTAAWQSHGEMFVYLRSGVFSVRAGGQHSPPIRKRAHDTDTERDDEVGGKRIKTEDDTEASSVPAGAPATGTVECKGYLFQKQGDRAGFGIIGPVHNLANLFSFQCPVTAGT
jgi:hypothetical protein